MGWLDRCYEAYEKNLGEVGRPSYRGEREAPVLLPVAHTTQKAQVEVSLSDAGEFLSARVLRPDEATTVIPCTEESGSRTSGFVPHPLADKLQYTTGDYAQYGGAKPGKFDDYICQLEAWCASDYGTDKLRAVLEYARKGTLVSDLVNYGVLVTGDDGNLVSNWKDYKGEAPAIASLLADETECFVRWRAGGTALHEDEQTIRSWSRYYTSQFSDIGTCFVTGRRMPLSQLNPYKIRNAGDRAKLISSNDSVNFTYRGERFDSSKQALHIGYETTQKAHSALRWLIGKQGISNGSQTILVWGTENEDVPPPTGDSVAFAGEDDLAEELSGAGAVAVDTTRTAFAQLFNRKALGYRAELGAHSQISVIILDAATPGRLSVRYYRELSGSRLIASVLDWHETFAWRHDYRLIKTEKDGKRKSIPVSFYGAPSPADIARAAYGENVDEKLVNQTVERLLPCITEGKSLPRDIMLSAVRRASNAAACEYYEARKVKSIACALVRGYHNRNLKEDYTMALKEGYPGRSYVFGRILACADYTEFCAENGGAVRSADRRPTNAQRMEVAFTQHPAKSCMLLEKKLAPYVARLIKNGQSTCAHDMMLRLIADIPAEDFNNRPLDELYLLGYASQRQAFFTPQNDKAAGDDGSED